MVKILYAEDEVSLSRASVHILSRQGYEVVPAYDGEEAVRMLRTQDFDLAILDIMMPKLDGIEVLKEIRRDGNPVKIIMLTAKAEIEDRLLGLENDADDYMTKPFDYRELLARMKRLLKDVHRSEIHIHDICIKTFEHVIESEANENARCSVTEEEIGLLEKMAEQEEVSKDEAVKLFHGDAAKTALYIQYINNKLKRLSSSVQVVATGNTLRLAVGL